MDQAPRNYERPSIEKVTLDEEGFFTLAACNKDIEGENGCWPPPLYRPGVGTPNRYNFDPS